ncbi:FAD-dependent oxidoreductase [Chlorobaculum sp. MV4-Y]|uniref:FAD-dependent oxidoreductase n=1 Tax=Chlorobaculum sp. MV4-Y TaxID=2976335 RepID=UPI0021AEFA6F|nr:FAD-dependent oxidoreductase [Chlorobaculum sp. MV4-Y]UWX57958.1 FAD-dependent oxidoreductase [Chlorobaculum sp. MV4-Y]
MQRREFFQHFLKRASIGAGALTAATASLVGYYQPRKAVFDTSGKNNSELPEKLTTPKKAVVIGGGLAGISSALELARRNFEVTLVEASPSLGGKLTGWPIEALGERFPVEHGFHGFFDQYYNLNEMFASAGIGSEMFTASPGYPVIFSDRQVEVFGQTPKWFPFNILSVVQQSKRLDIASFLKDYPGLWPVISMFRYQYDRTFHDWDSIDFMTYCKRGEVLPAFIDTVLHPFSDATMNRMEVLSAAEAIRYFHFYFMGSPEGLSFRITTKDCMSALIDPLEKKLMSMGVRVLKGQKVQNLAMQDGRVKSVRLAGTGAASGAIASIPKREVPVTGWLQHTSEAGIPMLVARLGAAWVALDGRCTHMGCPVAPEAGTGGFHCPCHDGRFNAEGVPVSGPPKAPLARLDVREAGEMLVIEQASTASSSVVVTAEELPCDYCVVASDVRGTRELIAGSQPDNRDFAGRVAALGEADPYVVWRVWLDRPLPSADFPFYTVSGYTYTDSITFYSSFQQPFIDWAKRIGGCVVELHAYAVAPQDIRPEPEIRAAMLQELYAMFPESKGATIRHEIFMMQSNFTRWAPGDHATRPGVETPYANLFLAGDWVSTNAPVFLMEAAAFTGRQAANAIAAKESLRQRPLPIVPMDGIFA